MAECAVPHMQSDFNSTYSFSLQCFKNLQKKKKVENLLQSFYDKIYET